MGAKASQHDHDKVAADEDSEMDKNFETAKPKKGKKKRDEIKKKIDKKSDKCRGEVGSSAEKSRKNKNVSQSRTQVNGVKKKPKKKNLKRKDVDRSRPSSSTPAEQPPNSNLPKIQQKTGVHVVEKEKPITVSMPQKSSVNPEPYSSLGATPASLTSNQPSTQPPIPEPTKNVSSTTISTNSSPSASSVATKSTANTRMAPNTATDTTATTVATIAAIESGAKVFKPSQVQASVQPTTSTSASAVPLSSQATESKPAVPLSDQATKNKPAVPHSDQATNNKPAVPHSDQATNNKPAVPHSDQATENKLMRSKPSTTTKVNTSKAQKDPGHHKDPSNVVTFGADNKPSFSINAVKGMIENAKAEASPVYVVSITGVFRSGKSFFINLMKLYLDYLTKVGNDENWEKDDQAEIKGLQWSRGQSAVTHGIWMWMYPNRVHGKVVLFIDCQGTGDNRLSTTTLDNLILYVGLQLSDVQIINVRNQLTSNDLDRLSLCALYADSTATGNVFEHLIFLIRDWENENLPDQLSSMFKTSATTRRSVNGIMKAFSQVETLGLCHPGRGVVKKSDSDKLTIANVDEEFIMQAKAIFKKLFAKLPIKTRNTGETLLQQFMMLSERAVDSVSSPLEVLGESLMSRAFEETKDYYFQQLKKVTDVRFSYLLNGMESAIETIHREVRDKFQSDTRVKEYASSDKQQEYLANLSHMKKEIVESLKYQAGLEDADAAIARQQKVLKDKQDEVDELKVKVTRLAGELATKRQKALTGGKGKAGEPFAEEEAQLQKLEKEAKENEGEEKDLFWEVDALIQVKHNIIQNESDRQEKEASYAASWVLSKYVSSRVARLWAHQN